jgi:hypothetical protein
MRKSHAVYASPSFGRTASAGLIATISPETAPEYRTPPSPTDHRAVLCLLHPAAHPRLHEYDAPMRSCAWSRCPPSRCRHFIAPIARGGFQISGWTWLIRVVSR